MDIYTIGHSNHDLDVFLALLKMHAIQLIVDVRSQPMSRFHPQFNKKALEASLAAQGIAYAFEGESLGGRPKDATCYRQTYAEIRNADKSRALDVEVVMGKDWFKEGAARLLETAKSTRLALLCGEEDPAGCHRHHLISRYLIEKMGWPGEILHIRKDGSLVPAGAMLLAEKEGPDQPALFPPA